MCTDLMVIFVPNGGLEAAHWCVPSRRGVSSFNGCRESPEWTNVSRHPRRSDSEVLATSQMSRSTSRPRNVRLAIIRNSAPAVSSPRSAASCRIRSRPASKKPPVPLQISMRSSPANGSKRRSLIAKCVTRPSVKNWPELCFAQLVRKISTASPKLSLVAEETMTPSSWAQHQARSLSESLMSSPWYRLESFLRDAKRLRTWAAMDWIVARSSP